MGQTASVGVGPSVLRPFVVCEFKCEILPLSVLFQQIEQNISAIPQNVRAFVEIIAHIN